jgi:hypothetical protein
MSVNGRFDGIRREDFLVHAERFRVPKPEALLADVRAAVASFGQFADEAGLKAAAWAGIAGQFQLV